MNIVVLIVTYNGMKWIDQCLQSLALSTSQLHTLVIDNQSTDETVSHITSNYPSVQLIQSDKNLGFGQANNLGLQLALELQADYVLLLNQDAWVESATIEQLIHCAQMYPAFWVLTPVQCHSQLQRIEPNFAKYMQQSNIDLLKTTDCTEMQFANAAVWLLPRKTIEQVGGFDPLFPHYGEDNDYINRLHYWGGRIGLVTTAKAYHDRETTNKPSIEKQIYKATLGIVGQLKNINKPLLATLALAKYRLFKKTVNYFFNLKFTELKTYWTAYFKAVLQLGHIVRQRKLSKEKRAFLGSR